MRPSPSICVGDGEQEPERITRGRGRLRGRAVVARMLEACAQLVVGEREVVVEGLVGVCDRELVVEDVRAGDGEHLPGARPAPRRRQRGWALAPTTAIGRWRSVVGIGAGGPVEGVLELAWIEALYSGVAIRSASAVLMAARRRSTGRGVGVLGVRGKERKVGRAARAAAGIRQRAAVPC